MCKEPRDLQSYNKDYYKEHCEKIRAKRRKMYDSNASFRNKAKQNSIEQYHAKRKLNPPTDRQVIINADGKLYYTIGKVAKALGKSVHTVRCYHRERDTIYGHQAQVIPDTTHTDQRGYRLYTQYQMSLLRKVFKAFDEGKIASLAEVNTILKKFWKRKVQSITLLGG